MSSDGCVATLLVCVLMAMLGGCSAQGKADGMKEGAAQGKRDGERSGSVNGYASGSDAGKQAASNKLQQGDVLQIYSVPLVLSLTAGAGLGICLQILTLRRLRKTRDYDDYDAMFLPGLDETETYRVWIAEQNLKREAEQTLHAARMECRKQREAMTQHFGQLEDAMGSGQRVTEADLEELVVHFDIEGRRIIHDAHT